MICLGVFILLVLNSLDSGFSDFTIPHAEPLVIVPNPSTSDAFPHPTRSHRSTPKFITYLPHSGFSNQLVELENALMIASLTQRTLILPPIYMGAWSFFVDNRAGLGLDMAWQPFDTLVSHIRAIEEKYLSLPYIDGEGA